MLVDTGATISILPYSTWQELCESERSALEPTDMVIKTGNSGKVDVKGKSHITFELEGMKYRYPFYVCGDARNPIIGFDFQQQYDMYLRPAENALYIGKKKLPCFDHSTFWGKAKVTMYQEFTIEPQHEAIVQGKVLQRKVNHDNKICVLDKVASCMERTGALVCRTTAKVNQGLVPVRMINTTSQKITIKKGSTLGLLEPVVQLEQMQLEGETAEICTCQCNCLQTTPEQRTEEQLCCHRLEQCARQEERYQYVSNSALYQTMKVHQAFETDEDVPTHVRQLYLESLPLLQNVQQKNRLAKMLSDYSDCFATSADDIGRTNMVKHKIDTGSAKPVRQRCRRFCKSHIEVIREQVKKLSANNTIRPSNSEWAANPVVVDKKTGDKRMCMDYRGLNAVTMNPDSYLLPRIDDTLDALSGAKYFCTLDLIQGYHHVELTEDSKEKTAFHAPYCNPSQWEYNYMPFGLVRAPRTFQRLMDKVIEGLEFNSALAYLDDVIVFGSTIDETMNRMIVVLDRLRSANLKLKAKKCLLFATRVKYLGHVISEEGVSTDPEKVRDIVNWHTPKTIKQTRSFLGMVNYYSRFVPKLAEIAHPLHQVTKKNAKFNWTEQCQTAFNKLKEKLASAPIMAYPTRTEKFILDTDASDLGYGAVLSQMQRQSNGEVQEKVIAYASKKFNDRESKYCARRRELLAIVKMVKHFDVYLRGPTFLIRTDHASLKYIKTVQPTSVPAQFFRWIMSLEEYSYQIEIRKGVLHGNADGMSRGCHGNGCICDALLAYERKYNIGPGVILEDTGSVLSAVDAIPVQMIMGEKCVIQECTVQAFKIRPKYSAPEIAQWQEEDPDIKPVKDWLRTEPEGPVWNDISRFSAATKAYFADYDRLEIHNEVLYRRWESPDGLITCKQLIAPRTMRTELCKQVHDTSVVAHLGRRKTLHALQHFCYWFKMHKDVAFWIQTCDSCQRKKPPVPTPKAPMKIYLPGEPGQRVAMDICGALETTTSGNKYVLVISDHFSKYTEAYPLKDQTAESVARVLVREWFVKKGPPEELHSDMGANFESKLIEELCRLYDIDKTRTSPYHPQGDGQVERFNKTLMSIVKGLMEKHKEWDEALPFAFSAYNATIHDTTKFTPNFLWHGRELRNTVGNLVPESVDTPPESYSAYAEKIKKLIQIAYDVTREHLHKSALKSKRYYDKNTHSIVHRPGDQILLKDHTKHLKGTKKYQDLFEGPYWVIDRLGDVNYRIQKDEHSAAKVAHHNRMRKYKVRGPVFVPLWVRLKSKYLRKLENNEVNPIPLVQPRAPTGVQTWADRRRNLRHIARKRVMKLRPGQPKKRPSPSTEDEEATDAPSVEETTPPKKRTRCGREVVPPERYR